MKKIIPISLVLLASCVSPKKVIEQMLKEKNVKKYQSYLAEDCKAYLKSKDDIALTTPYSSKVKSFQILDTEKGVKYYYVSAILTNHDGRIYKFINSPNNDLRFRLIREDGKWNVVLVNCIDFKDETLMKPGH